MLISILSIIAMFVVALVVKKQDEYTGWGVPVTFGLVFGATISFFVHVLTIPFATEHKYKTSEKEIVASKTGSITNGCAGGFFYVKGKVDETYYYFVLTKENGMYRQEKVPVESTVIIETTGRPKVVMNKHYSGTSACPRWIRFHNDSFDYIDEKDTIYVPVGTVENNIKFEVF